MSLILNLSESERILLIESGKEVVVYLEYLYTDYEGATPKWESYHSSYSIRKATIKPLIKILTKFLRTESMR